jgi:hypothetical protein
VKGIATMGVDSDGGVVYVGHPDSAVGVPGAYLTPDALDSVFQQDENVLLKFSSSGILEYGTYVAGTDSEVSNGPEGARFIVQTIAGEVCWMFGGRLSVSLFGSFPHIGTPSLTLTGSDAGFVQIICLPSLGPRYIKFSAAWQGARTLAVPQLLPNGLLYVAGTCTSSASLLHSRFDPSPSGDWDACIGCWRLSDGQVMFQSIVFNGASNEFLVGFSVNDEDEWIRGGLRTNTPDLPEINAFQSYEGSGYTMYYFGLRHIFTDCGVSWCQDFGSYSGTNGDDAYHAVAYSDHRFPHVLYANGRRGGTVKPTVNPPPVQNNRADMVMERIFIDQCGVPTLDWRFAGGEGQGQPRQCRFWGGACCGGDSAITWPAGGLPNAPSSPALNNYAVGRIFEGIDARCSTPWSAAPPLACNKCSNLNFQPAPCLTDGPCPESGACHCGTVGTTCDLLACDNCASGACKCGSGDCCSSTESCVSGSCVATQVEPVCPGVQKRYNLNLFGANGDNLGEALQLELCDDACFNGGMSCVISGRLNLQPAKFPGTSNLVLNDMELVPNPDCPKQGFHVGQDGGTRQFSNVIFNCKNGNKATLGKQGRGLLFRDASFGEVLVYEENDLTNCPKNAPICYVVEVYENTVKRTLIHSEYASAYGVPSAGPCPIGDPQPTCTAPDDFYTCTSGPSNGGVLTCDALTGNFRYRCSDGGTVTPDGTVVPGFNQPCTSEGAIFECDNLLTGPDPTYVGVTLVCYGQTKRMSVWGPQLSPSE